MPCTAGFTPNNDDSRMSSWMHSMEGRVEAMETQQRLFKSSIKGGAMTVYDADLNQVGRLGVGSYGSVSSGTITNEVFAFSNPAGGFHVLVDADEGWVFPKFSFNFAQDTFVAVTSGSFVNTWKSGVNIVGHGLELNFLVTADTATTGRVRLDLSGVLSDEITVAATEQKFIRYAWDLSTLFNFGASATLRIQGQRDTGTGNINVYSPDRCTISTLNQVVGATVGGSPS